MLIDVGCAMWIYVVFFYLDLMNFDELSKINQDINGMLTVKPIQS